MPIRVALHPFLAGLNRTQLALLADCAIAADFKPGQIILRRGEPAKRFYLIETGNVNIEAESDRGDVVIDTVPAGEVLGWSWMFPPYVWWFTGRATEFTRTIFFHGEILRKYCERDHSLGYELFKRMMPVMMKQLLKARQKLVAVHAGRELLEPATRRARFSAVS